MPCFSSMGLPAWWLPSSPHWQRTGALAGIIAIPLALIAIIVSVEIQGGDPSLPPAAPVSPTNRGAASTSPPADLTTAGLTTMTPVRTIAVGDCLSESRQSVPCTAIHRFEVIATNAPDCNASAAISYLGGNRDLDVLRAHYSLDASATCLVSNADDSDLVVSIKGILAVSSGSAGDRFRLCRDDRTAATDVGCNVPHTGEYVGAPAGTVPNQAGCESAAKAYLNLSINVVSDQLAVNALSTSNPDDGRPRCVITVRGNQVLTASIRNLRTNALPLTGG
jgi:hypothetical protein